jgi:2-oxoglutarate ferredoxin oxidoreductase subunit beta
MEHQYDMGDIDIAWCPGCGNFGILNSLKNALDEMDLDPVDVVLVSGIGQAAKIPHYLRCNIYNGLHGRALPPATAIKAVNPALTVIAESGDGDMYGEGGNHFIHAIRRNPDIVNIVHDNMIYGLTKGQASPTTMEGMKTTTQPEGVIVHPINPIATALSLGAGFVARTFSKDMEFTKDMIKEAMEFKGYALVDIFQPCVSFNKLNTFEWFEENTYKIGSDHDREDLSSAFELALKSDSLPMGIFYKNDERESFHERLEAYGDSDKPLWNRDLNRKDLLKKELENLV